MTFTSLNQSEEFIFTNEPIIFRNKVRQLILFVIRSDNSYFGKKVKKPKNLIEVGIFGMLTSHFRILQPQIALKTSRGFQMRVVATKLQVIWPWLTA